MSALRNYRFDQSDEQVIDKTLGDMSAFEELLADEVAQLNAQHAPDKENAEQTRYGGKALWWWRFKLLTWIHAREACSEDADDLPRGLRLALKQWDDTELLQFLKQLGRLRGQRQQQSRGRSA